MRKLWLVCGAWNGLMIFDAAAAEISGVQSAETVRKINTKVIRNRNSRSGMRLLSGEFHLDPVNFCDGRA